MKQTLDIEDSMMLFGRRKGERKFSSTLKVEIEAENAWLDGKDADVTPTLKITLITLHGIMYGLHAIKTVNNETTPNITHLLHFL